MLLIGIALFAVFSGITELASDLGQLILGRNRHGYRRTTLGGAR